MREANLMDDWRTVQVFLGEDGVSEVAADQNDPYKLNCTCKSFTKSSKCVHTKYVRKTMQTNDGHYTVHIHAEIEPEAINLAMESSESFREFIIKYGKVEVL
jgi:uncharacterized ferritin-like protein (DUF455 family)